MRFLYLDWPHLPLRLEAARRPPESPLPDLVVLGGQPWEPGTVLDCSAAARALGVRREQPLGAAHNLVPEARFLPADPEAYRSTFEEALEVLARFTPSLEGETDPSHRAFGQALLGIEGLARLWGDEPTLTARVTGSVASILPGAPRAGIGNTRFGAQVAAVVGGKRLEVAVGAARLEGGAARPEALGGVVRLEAIPAGDAQAEAAYLAPLSIRLLPAESEMRDRLRLFGLTRIGEFAALPRSAVLARFGQPGGDLHDLARGLDGRPLRPRRLIERLRADAELEPPVDGLEPLRFVLHHLCGTLCEQLSARGAGASHASLVLSLEGVVADAAPLRYDQVLPEPAAAPDLLERLLMARLEAEPPRAPVERLALELHGAAPAAGQQLGLFTPQHGRQARLDWQLTGLAIRFGPGRILQARLLDPEATLAEDRSTWRPAGTESSA
ncbi:MAG: DNA polymerase Y family protein [Chloroflexota bacterium]|nr:DNA polymerase Y family protein [Chloroflexota bacterium]